jgi:hypothetical protein
MIWLGARYIHRMQDNVWVFWDDYTDAGILDIPPPPETATSHLHGIIKYISSCTPTMPSNKKLAPPMDTVDAPIPDVSDDTPSLTPTIGIPAPAR